jgi:hypothetical protein
MGYAMGIDHQDWLPPFLPLGRNSDGGFARTLGLCAPEAFKVDLPFAVVHDPTSRRSFDGPDALRVYAACRVSEAIMAAMDSVGPAPPHCAPARHQETIGSYLYQLAQMKPDRFEEAMRDAVDSLMRKRMSMLDRQLQRSRGVPRYWAEDVDRAIGELRAHLSAPGPVLPLDLRHGRSRAECSAALQWIVGSFGRLLKEWDGIRAGAEAVASGLRRN